MFMENEYLNRVLNELETDGFLFVDNQGVIRNINRGITALLGYSEHDIIGQRIEFLLPMDVGETHKKVFSNYTNRKKLETPYKSNLIGTQRYFPALIAVLGDEPKRFSAIHKNQQEIPITLTINEVNSDSGDLIGFVAIMRNNTEQYTLQNKLQYQTIHDGLTGLITWQEFERRFYEGKKNILEKGMEFYGVILYLDIDYFRNITYRSQKKGDSVLQHVAMWLLNRTRQKKGRLGDSVLSRFVGDEFIIYLPATTMEGAEVVTHRLKTEFRKLNLGTEEQPFYTSFSIGVAQIEHSTKPQDALAQASNACRLAKEKGKDRIRVAQKEDTGHLDLEPTIREALQERRLKLYAQKIVAISLDAKSIDNNRAHYEVLVRMEDKHGNIISPVLFIPAAEKSGLAIIVDRYIIKQTLGLLQNNPAHVDNLSLCSINLSGISVSSERMLTFIEKQIRQSGVDPCKLCFEVTETHQIQDNEIAQELVSQLRRLGCKFAFDDFGIGHSNFQSFSRLPVDIIKIDGDYIRHVLEDNKRRMDIEGMINSAKIRGLEIVGEYAENEKIVRELKRLGVDYAQGYHFAKPVRLESLIEESLS